MAMELKDLLANHYTVDTELMVLRCRECHEIVSWITRHSAERHSIDVEVQPILPTRCGKMLPPVW